MQTKVALVTGAAQGIGRAIAQRLAHDGYAVALHDIHHKGSALSAFRDELKRDYPKRHHAVVTADMRKDEEVRDMVASVVEQSGSLDVLVANAGVGHKMDPIVETHISTADDVWAINLRGVWLCFHHAAKQMISQGRGGRIVSASSILGKTGYPGATPYSSSKFAIRGLTQSAALELGPHGITVNSYAPGGIATSLFKYTFDSVGMTAEVVYDKFLNMSAMKRNSEPEDVAALVSFLVSEGARNITGQTITVDGGMILD